LAVANIHGLQAIDKASVESRGADCRGAGDRWQRDRCQRANTQNAGGFLLFASPNVAAAMRVQAQLNGAGLSNDEVATVIKTARNVFCPQNGKV
jgi:hypothetical protein